MESIMSRGNMLPHSPPAAAPLAACTQLTTRRTSFVPFIVKVLAKGRKPARGQRLTHSSHEVEIII